MTRGKRNGRRPAPAGGTSQVPKKPGKAGEARSKPAPRERLAEQSRKLLGKHYANKYRTGRGG
jgi:hypothetical protein